MLARLAVVLTLLLIPTALVARTWKSADGKFTVDAEFIEVTGTDVKLKTAAGKEISVPLSKLSTADRLFALEEKKKAAKKPVEMPPAKAPAESPAETRPKPGKEPELATLKFKFGDREYEMDAPRGAAVLPESRFPMLIITPAGSDERMLVITPFNVNNMKNFRNDFVNGTKGNKAEKMLIDEEDAVACMSHIEAFERDAPVCTVNVTVGDRKLTVAHTDVLTEHWKAEDVLLFVKCAKSIRAAGAAAETATAPAPGKGKETASLTVKIEGKEYTVDAPVGAKVDANLVFPHIMLGGQLLFMIEPRQPQTMQRFRQFATDTEGMTVKQKVAESDETSAYFVHAEAINASAPVFLTLITVGGKEFACMRHEIGPTKLTADDLPFLIQCARTLKVK